MDLNGASASDCNSRRNKEKSKGSKRQWQSSSKEDQKLYIKKLPLNNNIENNTLKLNHREIKQEPCEDVNEYLDNVEQVEVSEDNYLNQMIKNESKEDITAVVKIKEELNTELTFKEEENVAETCSLRDRLHFEMDFPNMEVKKEVIEKTELIVKIEPEEDWQTEGSTDVNKTIEKTGSKSPENVSNKHLEKNIDTQESVKIKDEIDTDIKEESSYNHTSEDVNLYKDHVIKEEIVIGPEIVQNVLPPNSIKIVIRKPIKSKHKSDKKSHTCDHCSKKFSSSEKMRKHLKKHEDENKNKCPVCGKSFSFIGNMKRHMKIHTGNKPHRCDLCDLNFNRKDYLKFHIQKHHSGKLPTDKDYTCSFCNKGLASRSTLQYHKKFSCPKNKDKIKPKFTKMYTCDLCLQSYKYRTSLCAHIMRRHTNNKLPIHECNECGQKYLKKHNLQCHMQAKHLNIHPYKCKECKETFTWNSTLVAHERKFHGRED